MKIIFELSGEHPTLPFAELTCIGTLTDYRPQVAVAEVSDPGAIHRLALTHRASVYLGESPADIRSITRLIQDLRPAPEGAFAVRVNKIQGSPSRLPPRQDIERLLGNLIPGHVSLENPLTEYRIVISGDRCFVGMQLVTIDRGTFNYRTPLRRAFFHPGVMLPRTARALVNISRIQAGELLLDPFCGTGGILIEADLVGAGVVGGDADPFMVTGSRANIPAGEFVTADATVLPLKDRSMDAVVTDLPYGQSSCITARSLEILYTGTLSEIYRVLRAGRFAVVVTHQDIRPMVPLSFKAIGYHEQRVHRSLTRHILILQR